MRLHNLRFEQPIRSRQVLGRALFCAAILCCVAGLPGRRVRAASKADRAAGAVLFRKTGCEQCHGVDGIGTDRGPSLTTVGKRLKKDRIRRQILEGGKQMPAFGDVLTADETRKLVDYLAHKKKAPRPAPPGQAGS